MKKYEMSRVVLLVDNFKRCAVVVISISSKRSVAISFGQERCLVYCERLIREA